ncbi:hypothetical protein DP113_28180 [Brasilonema octagenarum UFV-E1]|uniref:Uncharacterized protein n=2 Tax=Brasilonema TaxID=383614 RepID=A0A856MPL5_9CYAN|nr:MULTISPECIES: hypothetical protein [Brasilonema]NMF66843.1 hypothetical protein [Brasilonema octagenarum UFV-OR1]QDL11267.1 hypothetical protein DP114_28250 [Brasilonema sennae CENA114]QDL17612.1 hypothetical protein DP113_28180 [Brasilonema octagenarum UFV-E1]
MKFIVGLSSLALFSLSSISPCLAASQSINPSTDQSLSSQSLPNVAKTIQVAQTFRSITQEINTVDREIRNTQRARQRQERLNFYRQRKQERAAAAAARREQERRYFESLTPEQQKQYIAQKRARQEQQAKQMLLMLGVLGAAMGGNSGASSQQTQEYYYIQNPSTPSYNSAPPSTAPIGPIYGSGPGGSFYGN